VFLDEPLSVRDIEARLQKDALERDDLPFARQTSSWRLEVR
jgi:hypothetical protein